MAKHQKNPVYQAIIDTTFAVYNKKFFKLNHPLEAVRVAGDSTCQHLPWYQNNQLPIDEATFYRQMSQFSYYLSDRVSKYERDL